MYPKTGAIEYYDLEKDPWETRNLLDKKYSNTPVKELLIKFQKYQLKVGDTLRIDKIYKKYLQL